jgi:DNA excision repair protein ERCC-4
VSFIQSKDAKDTAAWLKTLARHIKEGAQDPHVPKPKDLAGQQMRMLQGINGIGPGRARELLEHFGTPAAVVNATMDELTEAVGPATAEKVFTFVRTAAARNTGAA